MGMCGFGTKKSMCIVDINSEEGKGEISPHVIYCFDKFEKGNSFTSWDFSFLNEKNGTLGIEHP